MEQAQTDVLRARCWALLPERSKPRETSMPELPSVIGAKRLEALLRGWVADGALRAGEKVPSEEELVAEFRVSRPTIRLVMIRLVADGLLRGEHGRGFFVRDGRERRR